MIAIDRVSMAFGRNKAVDDAAMTVAEGESLALWGANGAGKTTLIRCAIGLLRFSGRIAIGGHDVARHGKAARMLVGYVPQELGFYDDLEVAEAVRYFASLKGISRIDVDAALSGAGIGGHGGKRIRELSGGMKQRLALALALVGDPPVLILDEVTASLDAVGRSEFVGLLERLSGAGRTMLFASHRLDEIGALADRVACMEKGRIARIVARDGFLRDQDGDAMLHLAIAQPLRETAIASLRAVGFAPRMNGVGILVPITREQKSAPFTVLTEARIRIDDFELVTAPAGGRHAVEVKP